MFASACCIRHTNSRPRVVSDIQIRVRVLYQTYKFVSLLYQTYKFASVCCIRHTNSRPCVVSDIKIRVRVVSEYILSPSARVCISDTKRPLMLYLLLSIIPRIQIVQLKVFVPHDTVIFYGIPLNSMN